MADQGFVVNTAVVTGIQTTYVSVLMEAGSLAAIGIDARAKALPQSCYLSHLELKLDETAGTVATVDCYLTWDLAGNEPLTAAATGVTLHAGSPGGDTSLRNTAIALDVWVNAPTAQTTAGTVYLWLKIGGGGTATLTDARIQWVSRHD